MNMIVICEPEIDDKNQSNVSCVRSSLREKAISVHGLEPHLRLCGEH